MDSGIKSDPEQWTDARHRRGLAGEEREQVYKVNRYAHIRRVVA